MTDVDEVKSIKHRVLGTLVLVSLAVIFLPMLFSPDDELFSGQHEVVPAPPDKLKTIIYRLDDDGVFTVETPAAPAAAVEVEEKPTLPDAPIAEPVESIAEMETEQEKPVVAADLPEGLKRWMVQLGSFRNEENAQRLRDQIREMGYPAYLDARKTADKTIWRVRVGPYAAEKEAETVLTKLKMALKLDGLVIRHQ